LHPERFFRTFMIEAARVGLPRIRCHDLRHTWATLALSAGEHPKVLQDGSGTRTCRSLRTSTPTSPRACMGTPPPASQGSSSGYPLARREHRGR
jgi:integrase